MIEDVLLKIADKIVRLDEASLASLWNKYRERVENVELSRDWEKAVIVFFIINAVRAKNEILNEYIQEKNKSPRERKPNLRLIKPPS
ncbi:MAG: hypothetical protein N2572_05815 [Syntrophales bacterium]|nr:hypothetical protein [Syntrophales bacterium]